MEFFRRPPALPAHIAVFPGTFNPPTVAHLTLARTALGHADQVLFVLPRTLPHKDWDGASFVQRVELLADATAGEPRFGIAATGGGLFREIAAACRSHFGAGVRLTFLCGRDAAERIVGWDYGDPGALADMFREFDLLVAARRGDYRPPESVRAHIHRLEVDAEVGRISATEVRRRIERDEPWENLVPAATVAKVRVFYAAGRESAV